MNNVHDSRMVFRLLQQIIRRTLEEAGHGRIPRGANRKRDGDMEQTAHCDGALQYTAFCRSFL